MTELERELSKELQLQREAFERELEKISDAYARNLAAAESRMKRMQQSYENELKQIVALYEQKLKEIAEKPVKVALDESSHSILIENFSKLQSELVALEERLEELEQKLAKW